MYQLIQRHFIEKIMGRELSPHDKIPTEKELTDQFGVSRITVAKALSELTRDGWIYRIPGKGSFVAERSEGAKEPAKAPALPMKIAEYVNDRRSGMGRTPLIGFIIPHIDSMFAQRLLHGVQTAVENAGYRLVVMFSDNFNDKERVAIVELLDMGVSGLIIFPTDETHYNDDILILKLAGFPFVLVDRYLPGIETNLVCSDNVKAARKAVSYLWELGHRQIAICSNFRDQSVNTQDRIRGYMDELKARGALINPDLIITEAEDPENPEGEVLRCLQKHRATALIVMHCNFGMKLYREAAARGFDIPRDLSLLTFDNPIPVPGVADFTHVSQNEERMGAVAADILLRKLRGEPSENGTERIILEPEIRIGSTTGSPPRKSSEK